jgi:aldose 1-epimerase
MNPMLPLSTRALLALSVCLTVMVPTGGAVDRLNSPKSVSPITSTITEQPFGALSDGVKISVFTLRNAAGAEARILDYGGIVVSLRMPDRQGALADVVLGHDTLDGYVHDSPYYGAVIGRCANRIREGRFTLNGKPYALPANFFGHHLHGGNAGFDKRVWTASASTNATGAVLALVYTSPDGEEGYPGALSVKAVYTLTDWNELKLDFTAVTDKPTLCNLTQHSYFNLAGAGEVLDHRLTIPAERFTPLDKEKLPTGAIAPVAGTPLDFRRATALGKVIGADHEQLKITNGFDHNWVFDKRPGELSPLARLEDPASGRIMEVLSTAPGLQVYTPDFGDGAKGKAGQTYRHRGAVCLEPQAFPDAPNHTNFLSVVLNPGQTYRHTIVYRFSVAN